MKKNALIALLTLLGLTLELNAQESSFTTKVEQGKVTTGIGNKDVAILRSTLTISDNTGVADFQQVTGKIIASSLKDVKGIRAYFATNAQELYIDKKHAMKWRENNGMLFAKGKVAKDGTYTIRGNKKLTPGTYYLWIALDISTKANEGNTVDATITSYIIDGKELLEPNGNPANAATIFLTESSVLMPMDKGNS